MTESRKEKLRTFFRYKISGMQKLVMGVLIGFLAGFICSRMLYKNKPLVSGVVEDGELLLEETLISHTTAEFEEAVLGYASAHSELIVMEQPVAISTTVTKAGLANLAIFSKIKNITFYGTGVYTVDMGKISRSDIIVDHTNHTVTLYIPKAELQYVNYDLEKTEYEDTERGLLAFGELKLTAEEMNALEQSVVAQMSDRLNDENLLLNAEKIGEYKIFALMQSIVSGISYQYRAVVITR